MLCLCAGAGEGSVYKGLPRDPGVLRVPEPKVYLQETGLEDSQGSSRTHWATLLPSQGLPAPLVGLRTYWGLTQERDENSF